MIFRLGFVFLGFCVALPVSADIRTIVRAVETSTAFMNVPTSEHSRLTFNPCEDRAFIETRLTPATQYFVRREPLSFADVRKAFSRLGRSPEDYALISFDTETNTVTSIRLADPTGEPPAPVNHR